ncbi:glycoside hydrolase family 15 protein [Teredinibacter turnerae]|uniref:glycoside hydrolase family 15 protein n=1 Tax=Teredinibacter turnerae TaxID=2426 RepID=UPI0003637828|nr:glycoside hydrolase family 15 protein [Teredinibacter turnerae]
MESSNLELALIGNCSIGALIDNKGTVSWMCYPRFDGEPVFCSLLKSEKQKTGGSFAIDLIDLETTEQAYEHNTAIVKTRLMDRFGNGIEILDFAPRFHQYGRIHRPTTIMRKIIPIGSPRVKVRCNPNHSDGAGKFHRTQGSNHIRYMCDDLALRLTTDLSVTAILDETTFVLGETKHLVFGEDVSITENISELTDRFFTETESYWQEWCRYLAIPYEWQEAVIRAAITLKLSSYEDTGAIIAAMTTSIPEAANTVRNWDYRFCWLRDSYFTVQSLNRLGVTRTMEQYLQYIINIVATMSGRGLQPVYCINSKKDMPERLLKAMDGYRGMGPVRIGNQAAEQIQHDVYGAVILSATQMFFDERIRRRGDEGLFRLLEHVGELALANYNQPDAGLWELRGQQHVHTFSSMMCWTAADRLAKIADKLSLAEKSNYWREQANKIKQTINERGFNKSLNAYTATWDGDTLDASLLLAFELGFVEAKSPEFIGTLEAIEKHLKPAGSKYLFRYVTQDDFGEPENAFTICSFWYIDALAAVGRKDEARKLFEDLLERRNSLGLLSEDINPETGELWGNFPQTYSMVGIINSARVLSKRWEEAL